MRHTSIRLGVAALLAAAALAAALSLLAMTAAARPVPAGATHVHAATRLKCRVVKVRRHHRTVRHRVCKRVKVPVPPTHTTTTTGAPVTPPPVTSTPTDPGTTTVTTSTPPPPPVLNVREFLSGSLMLTLSSSSVPAGTYTVHRTSETAFSHTLDIRPTGAPTATATFPLLASGSDSQTVVLTPGQWTFRCTVVGHAAMTATLTVTP
ncbi:MAG: hypothetical protein U0Y82_05360 [Thermoleophilia bacterium]